MLVYLAGPIDGVSHEDCMAWRRPIKSFLHSAGFTVFDPYTAWDQDGNFEDVPRTNRLVLASAKLMIAYLDGPGLKIGTIREIEYYSKLNKPFVLITSAEESLEMKDAYAVIPPVHMNFFVCRNIKKAVLGQRSWHNLVEG